MEQQAHTESKLIQFEWNGSKHSFTAEEIATDRADHYAGVDGYEIGSSDWEGEREIGLSTPLLWFHEIIESKPQIIYDRLSVDSLTNDDLAQILETAAIVTKPKL